MNTAPHAANWTHRRPKLAAGHEADARVRLDPFRPACPRAWRWLRAVRRIILLLLWNFSAYLILGVAYVLPGGFEKIYPMIYWQGSCALMGIDVRVIGKPAVGHGRSVIFVPNHSSWLDIPVLGTVLMASFIAKDNVKSWPLIGSMAKFARTLFVSRSRSSTGRERDEMAARLNSGDNLILFAEGTSSDGVRVLPFRSTFFAVAPGTQTPIFQPVSLVYDRLVGLPATRSTRPIFAWYGDMELFPHLWGLVQWGTSRCTIILHPPLDPNDFANRKDLALAAHKAVAEGAAALRQGRGRQA